ncbi:MAG: glycosyltransferase family 4 protein [Chloroflexota bacterium]
MQIALLTMSFPPQTGGVQTYLSQIFRRVALQHPVTVITLVKPDDPSSEELPRLHPRSSTLLGYFRALRHIRPDRIVVGHAHPRLLLPSALYSGRSYLALAYGNDYLAAQKRWHRRLFNRLLRNARPLITITHSNARRLEEMGAGKASVIYPGTDAARFSPADSRKPTNMVLLTVGRLVPRKGIDTVLEALSMLRQDFPEISYRIAGAGPDETRLRALVERLELQNIVQFLGKVPDDALPDVYRQADIFVMPVREEAQGASIEGFGIVYLEASASGLPVIAGRSGGAAEAVLDGKTGLVVEPNAEGVAAAITTLLNDASLRKRLGAAGRRWVETEMNWDRAARQMAEALDVEPE